MRVSLLLEHRRRRRRQPPPHARPPRTTPKSVRPGVSDRTIVGIDQHSACLLLWFPRTSSRPGMNTALSTKPPKYEGNPQGRPFPSWPMLGRASSPSRVRFAAQKARALDCCGRPAKTHRPRGKGAGGSVSARAPMDATGAGCRNLGVPVQGEECLLTSPFIELQSGLRPQRRGVLPRPSLPRGISVPARAHHLPG